MLKSELIEELQKSIEAHGDGEVYVQDAGRMNCLDDRYEAIECSHDKIHDNNYEFIITY